MFACTASSAIADEYLAVMTPSKKFPLAALLLSPPVPRPTAPCLRMGLYLALGRGPSNGTLNGPDCASPTLMVQWFLPATSPLTMPVTYFEVTGVLASNGLLFPAHRPFSRSPMIHGPAPAPLPQMVQFP